MIGVYFSGTGNTKYCVEYFLSLLDEKASCISIENSSLKEKVKEETFIVLGYPIYYSNLPKIFFDFLEKNKALFEHKDVFIICTMALFSGDGAGCAARILRKYGANIIGGLHLKMPDCIADVKLLKKTPAQNHKLIQNAEQKIRESILCFKNGKPTQDGLSLLSQLVGLFGQRLWFQQMVRDYSNKLTIDKDCCIACGKCISSCPMKNLYLKDGVATPKGKCTMCYRCVNECPVMAITLIGKKVHAQWKMDIKSKELDG